MQQRHLDRRQYFEELAETSQKYFLPFLEKSYGEIENARILEIGCGDGGNLLPFIQKGCRVTGVDISLTRIEQARCFFEEKGLSPELICADVFELTDLGLYDIVIVHDVIEHIERKKEFLIRIKDYLEPSGLLYVAFPAWQMPFGGHQQICQSKILSHMPFLHLLPAFLYKTFLQWGGEKANTIEELLDIKKCGLRIEQFRELAVRCNLKIIQEELYFINPHYEIKFKMKPYKLAGLFSNIPYFRNYYTSSCFYLLRKL